MMTCVAIANYLVCIIHIVKLAEWHKGASMEEVVFDFLI